ncbi:hypothetical protein M9H77_03334 [Catharanthus roseus]|uniref:Uncharacterized protein n=1 Tax=Catharanthus roseus TaxID=4058 RepID=A0ACC0CBF6_CATRO|nr:hypothetical protein M9H77_03334 [Catharanthus roseus]
MLYEFPEDTKNQLERLEGQTKPITKEMKNNSKKAKIEPTAMVGPTLLSLIGIEDKGKNIEKELRAIHEELPISLALNPSLMCYMVSFQGFLVGVNIVQAIRDWPISKSAFEEKNFHGLAIFYRKYIKDFIIIASSLLDVPEKKIGFPCARLKKNKFEEFEGQGKASKLFSIFSISKDHSMEQFDGEKWLSMGGKTLYHRR